jgi:hypothetical protein
LRTSCTSCSLVFVLVVLVAGCGGSDETGEKAALVGPTKTTASEEASLPTWVEKRLAAKSGPDVALVRGTSDHAVGANRVSFLVVRKNGSLVRSPRASVLVARDGQENPVATTATLVPLGSHTHPEGSTEGHAGQDATELYVANIELPKPGRYWFVVEPAGEAIQAIGSIDALEETVTPPIGSKAVPSDNPTLAALLRYSIADSLEAGVTCGPTVESSGPHGSVSNPKRFASSTSRSTRATTPRTMSTAG